MGTAQKLVVWQNTAFPISPLGIGAEEAALANLGVCATREKKLFRRMQDRVGTKAFPASVNAYLRTKAVRFFALAEQAKKLDYDERLPLSVYAEFAGSFSLFAPILEPVSSWKKAKSSGKGFRVLYEFGPMMRAAQHMMLTVISLVLTPKPYQYAVPGRGAVQAIEFVKTKVLEGYHHVLKLDCTDFFGSFSREGLHALLPLPIPVIDNVVMPDNLIIKPKKGGKALKLKSEGNMSEVFTPSEVSTHSTSPWPSPSGLVQGSSCGPIVAEFVVSQMKLTLPEGVVVVIYVDDILIMAKDPALLDTAKSALLSAYGESPAGDFAFKVSEEDLPSGLVFLGHYLKKVPHQLITLPSQSNMKEHKSECRRWRKRIKMSAHEPTACTEALAGYFRYLTSWISAFRACGNFHEQALKAQMEVVKLCSKHQIDLDLVKAAAKASFVHHVVKVGYTTKVKVLTLDAAFRAAEAPGAVPMV